MSSKAGYGLLPGSWHAENEVFYEVQADRPVVQLPQEVYDTIRKASGRVKAEAKKKVESGVKIPEGERDITLTRYAGYMQGCGMPESVTLDAIEALARDHCNPPYTEAEMAKLPATVARFYRDWDDVELDIFSVPEIAPEARKVSRRPEVATEVGASEGWRRAHGKSFRYFLEEKAWMFYKDGRWYIQKGTHAARQAYEKWHRGVYEEYAADLPDTDEYKEPAEKFSKMRGMRAWRDNVLNVSESHLLVTAADLDRNPMALAVGNGLLDLTTLELREGKPEDYITLGTSVNYVPGARTADLERYLLTTFPDDGLRAYVQRFCGLSLTGITKEERFWIWIGGGRNGKGTLSSLLEAVLTDELYAAINFATLASDKYISGSAASPDVARLRGKRLVVATEKHSARMIDEERIKKLTGGDLITARHLHKEDMQFPPLFKLVMSCNQKPHLNVVDDAIRERVIMVPFTSQFTRENGLVDLDLKDRLREPAGLEAALAWAVEGLRAYHAAGLGSCSAIEDATSTFMEEMNPLVEFIGRFFEQGETLTCTGTEVSKTYDDYLQDTMQPRLGNADLGDAMRVLGFVQHRTAMGMTWRGLALKGATL